MSALKNRMAAVADRLIDSYGFDSVIRRITGGGIDPVTGADTSETTDYDVKAVAKSVDIARRDATIIQAGDRLYVITSAVEPMNGDKFKVDDRYWDIVNWEIKQVQDGAVAYIIQVRS